MEIPISWVLAPIQEAMLRDSAFAPEAGHHVEQLEMVFSRWVEPAEVVGAWRKTVQLCEVLRTSFTFDHSIPTGLRPAVHFPEMEIHYDAPTCWETWLEVDRCLPLLGIGGVPWRTALWPEQCRFVWTFHHALLDGRSITKVIQLFLELLAGGSPQALTLARWQRPSPESLELAENYFHQFPEICPPTGLTVDENQASGIETGSARQTLGECCLAELEVHATALEVTVATIVIWAWGQALTEVFGSESVVVEQIRAGAPQAGSAGFTMNVLPLCLRRGPISELRKLRIDLLEMRRFERVSPEEFTVGIYPDTAEVPTIMIEHATLFHSLGDPALLDEMVLRERPAAFSSAIGWLRPDLQLRVEGPHSQRLLDRWCEVLTSMDRGIDGVGPSIVADFSFAEVRGVAGRV